MHRALGLALTGGLSIVVAACDATPPTANLESLIDGPQIPHTTLGSSSGITGDADTGAGSDAGGTTDPGAADTGMADTDAPPANCNASADACDKCCQAKWGEGASGIRTNDTCTHCNVPQGEFETYNECKTVCQELNCETETYNSDSDKCLCGLCPGP